ncbi:glycosyltransferase family 2 protein [Pseudosulfitobacter pseudonitzschiae]|uniref:Glycosyl transferase family 2 n=2 Tax=Rhodobacterales TaxID=204455 RepID=A0A221JZN4_9RHOB|nr:glycosyl transferase family 2 [Pseudosulfitobacter pseudonitzschiae]
MQTVAVVTMVRDDAFFLKAWLRHYGEMFGRQNCYVVNHGYGEEVAELAKGCNIIGIPGDPHKNFDVKRWSLLNNLFGGLRRYYKHVIVGDVDELVVVDPDAGVNLLQWLEKAETDRIYTPVGLEVIHRIDLEDEPAEAQILGPRRHVRIAPHYSKPCIVSTPAKLSRGGHFAQYPKLHTPDDLYLMHLKFCDFGAYTGAMDRRNAVSAEVGVDYKQASIGRHWFAQARGEDREVFDAFAELPMQDGFDMRVVRRKMHRSFKARGDTGYFEFDRPNYKGQYVLPERFSGIF